jgi:polyhydroxybutyrate depolymerase
VLPAPLVAVAVLALLAAASSCGLFDRVDLGVEGVAATSVGIRGHPGRTAIVAEPDDVVDGEGLPMVVLLHGLGATAADLPRDTEWASRVAERRFVLVAPQGTGNSWDAVGCCDPAAADGVDDVAFLADVIDQIASSDHVDRSRVYLTGYSNGGMMTYRYLCANPGGIVAAASVAGTDTDDCDPTAGVPFLQVSGDADNIVPLDGGPSANPLLPVFEPSRASVRGMAEVAACTPPSVVDIGIVTVTAWEGCSGGGEVSLHVVHGLDHRYPTAAVTDGEYVGADTVLDFFGITAR